MSCTSPIYRVPVGSQAFNQLCSWDQQKLRNHGVILSSSGYYEYSKLDGFPIDQVQPLRCGRCLDCRLNHAKDSATRCYLESTMHEYNYFVTLTYDDYNLPLLDCIDFNGDVWNSILVRSHIQQFVKKFREYERYNNGLEHLKVYYVGEYGDLNGRPHFHIILFGVNKLPDLIPSFRRDKFQFYKSDILSRCWKGDFGVTRGFVEVCEANFDTMAYTARYCTKKLGGAVKDDFLDYYDTLDPIERLPIRPQPFNGMSLKPGIGYEYFQLHKGQIYSEDAVKLSKNFELFKSKPPRYFDKLFDAEHPDLMRKIKKSRKDAGILSAEAKLKQFSEPIHQRLEREAKILERKYAKYIRDL